ncbi:MAG: F0F1 ATP synthase subunit B [Pseudanabaenaceae cyanobacterium]
MNTVILGAEGFSLNTNILETNLINLGILIVILVNFGRSFLGKLLAARLERIETAIEEAEARQQSAQAELEQAQANLAQAQQEAERIIQGAEQTAEAIKNGILAKAVEEIDKLRIAADQEIASEQERVIKQLRRQVIEQSLQGVQDRLNQGLSADVQHQLIDRSLALLSK